MTDDHTSQADEHFFSALGRLTVSWASLEFGLDSMVKAIYDGLNGAQIEAEMPRALQRKVAFLRKAFNTIPDLAPMREGFGPLADDIMKSADARHTLIHGVIIEHNKNEGSVEVRIARLMREKTGFSRQSYKVTTLEIIEHAGGAQRLASVTLRLGLLMLERYAST